MSKKNLFAVIAVSILVLGVASSVAAKFWPQLSSGGESLSSSSSEVVDSSASSSEAASEATSEEASSETSSESSSLSSISSSLSSISSSSEVGLPSSYINTSFVNVINSSTGGTSGYKEQYLVSGGNSYHACIGQMYGGVFYVGWTADTAANLVMNIPAVNAATTSKYVYMATEYYVTHPSDITISYTSASTTTLQLFVLVRDYGSDVWRFVLNPLLNSLPSVVLGGSVEMDFETFSSQGITDGYYQFAIGFVSTNSTAKISGLSFSFAFLG